MEIQATRACGTEIPIELTVTRLNTEGPPLFAGFVRDCTKQKQTQAALLESNERFELVVRGTEEGIWDWNIESGKMFYAARWKSMLGYDDNEINNEKRLHPDERAGILNTLKEFLGGSEEHYEQEYRLLHRNGKYLWVLTRGTVLRRADGTPYRMAGSNIDLTSRKTVQDKLLEYQRNMQKLTSELALSEERERRHFATVLHDRIGQDLSYCYFKLESRSCNSMNSNPDPAVTEVLNIINTMIQETRALTFEMSPPILYEIGLESALEWLSESMQQRYGFNCSVEVTGAECALELRSRIILFHIVRELLHNVAKHARAKTAVISIQRSTERWRVDVTDDGIGMKQDNLQSRIGGSGFGIFSIRERLHYVGGSLNYSLITPSGTKATIDLPLGD